MIAYGKEQGAEFPAAEWCAKYSKNAVQVGEGFLPAIHQLELIVDNRCVVNQALRKIGGAPLRRILWSSSEYKMDQGWIMYGGDGNVGMDYMVFPYYVRCVLAF